METIHQGYKFSGNSTCLLVAALTAYLAIAICAAQEFTQISGDFGDITEIEISSLCGGMSGNIPNTMWTIEPTTDATEVYMSPADLFDVSFNGGKLSFEINPDVASGATSGAGVRIGVPAGRLQKVTLAGANTAQILDGFQTVEELDVAGASTLMAIFGSSEVDSMLLRVGGASSVTLTSNSNLSGGSIHGASTVKVETPLYDNIDVKGASTLGIQGSVGSGSVSGASRVTATGETTGPIAAGSASTVYLSSCDSVTTGAAGSCNAGSWTVGVSIPSMSETGSGDRSVCTHWFGGDGWGMGMGMGMGKRVTSAGTTTAAPGMMNLRNAVLVAGATVCVAAVCLV